MIIDTLLICVDELWLKGKNRKLYVKEVCAHIKKILSYYHNSEFTLKNENQRLVLKSDVEFSEDLIDALKLVPGIYSISLAYSISPDLSQLLPSSIEVLNNLNKFPETFRVTVSRIDKTLRCNSVEVAKELGGDILEHFNGKLKVKLKNYDLNLHIFMLSDYFYIVGRTEKGVGGLPVRTSGHLVTLISGGFDSPVASYMMSKRGCRQTFIFFYAYPYVGDEVVEKITSICSRLGRFQNETELYVVPFGDIQNHIADNCRYEYRTSLFRKAMIETADLLANRLKADALCTGDCLGQVSSQTIYNMTLLDQATNRLILRPLLGMNKSEVMSLAEQIGTHDLSLIPHDDACSLFAPKNPIIRPDKKYWTKYSEEVQMSELLSSALDKSDFYMIKPNGQVISQ